jgi:hypothetical protein
MTPRTVQQQSGLRHLCARNIAERFSGLSVRLPGRRPAYSVYERLTLRQALAMSAVLLVVRPRIRVL